jgi:hypothetical protein
MPTIKKKQKKSKSPKSVLPSVSPDFIRMPAPGKKCPYTGLSRYALDELVRPQVVNGFRPPVESRIMQKGFSRRVVRLVSYQSLMDYLTSLPTEARPPTEVNP